jgi:hypothetical protein
VFFDAIAIVFADVVATIEAVALVALGFAGIVAVRRPLVAAQVMRDRGVASILFGVRVQVHTELLRMRRQHIASGDGVG